MIRATASADLSARGFLGESFSFYLLDTAVPAGLWAGASLPCVSLHHDPQLCPGAFSLCVPFRGPGSGPRAEALQLHFLSQRLSALLSGSHSLSVVSVLTHFLTAATGFSVSSDRYSDWKRTRGCVIPQLRLAGTLTWAVRGISLPAQRDSTSCVPRAFPSAPE